MIVCIKHINIQCGVMCMAFSVHVNMNRCTGCGICVVACPVNALELHTLDPVTKEKIYTVKDGKSISLDVKNGTLRRLRRVRRGMPVQSDHPFRKGRDRSAWHGCNREMDIMPKIQHEHDHPALH